MCSTNSTPAHTYIQVVNNFFEHLFYCFQTVVVPLRRHQGLDPCHFNLGYFFEKKNTSGSHLHTWCHIDVNYSSLFHHFFSHYVIDQSVQLFTTAAQTLHFCFIAYHSDTLTMKTSLLFTRPLVKQDMPLNNSQYKNILVMCHSRTSSNRQKVEPGKFHIHTRKNLFTVPVLQHWNRLTREVTESLSLETFQTYLYVFLYDLLQATCFGRGVGLSLQRSLPTPAIL